MNDERARQPDINPAAALGVSRVVGEQVADEGARVAGEFAGGARQLFSQARRQALRLDERKRRRARFGGCRYKIACGY